MDRNYLQSATGYGKAASAWPDNLSLSEQLTGTRHGHLLIVADHPALAAQPLELCEQLGFGDTTVVSWRELLALLPAPTLPASSPGQQPDSPRLIIACVPTNPDSIQAELLALASYLSISHSRMIVLSHFGTIDAVYGCFAGQSPTFLVEPDDAELMVTLIEHGFDPGAAGVREPRRVSSAALLSQVSDQLLQVTRSLAALAEREAAAPQAGLNETPLDYSGAILDGGAPLSARLIREEIRRRRQRERFFDAGMFADPAWDMLLDLMAARIEARDVSVSSLCIAAAVPPTTALRWIKLMTEAGLFERHADPDDARRVFIRLTDRAADAMARYHASL